MQKGSYSIYNQPKPNVPWMTVKSLSSIYYVLAAKYKEQQKTDYLFIANDKGEICEELVSNIILQKGEEIIVPSRKSGGVYGVTLRHILKNYHFQITERAITEEYIKKADAIYSCKGSTGVSRIV